MLTAVLRKMPPYLIMLNVLVLMTQAHAQLAGEVIFDFESGNNVDFLSGTSTPGNMNAAVFPAFGQSYVQGSIQHTAIGFGSLPGVSPAPGNGGTSHVHGATTNGSRVSQLEADAGGGLFQLTDGDSFSVRGIDIAGMNLGLTNGLFTTVTLRGYTSSDLSTFFDVIVGDDGSGNPIDAAGGIFSTETGTGFNGTHLHLDDVSAFSSIFLLEYWFDAVGRGINPNTVPQSASLIVEFDNVVFGPSMVAAVPIPAAVYLFGAGLLTMLGFSRSNRKRDTV